MQRGEKVVEHRGGKSASRASASVRAHVLKRQRVAVRLEHPPTTIVGSGDRAKSFQRTGAPRREHFDDPRRVLRVTVLDARGAYPDAVELPRDETREETHIGTGRAIGRTSDHPASSGTTASWVKVGDGDRPAIRSSQDTQSAGWIAQPAPSPSCSQGAKSPAPTLKNPAVSVTAPPTSDGSATTTERRLRRRASG